MTSPPGTTLALAVEGKLDARVRPLLQIHGGEVTLESVDDGQVRVRFEGACVGCPLRPVTLSVTIERELGADCRGRVGQRGRGTGQPARRRQAAGGVRRPPGGRIMSEQKERTDG